MNSPLKSRIMVALWGIPLILGLTYGGGWWTFLLVEAITLAGMLEFYQLAQRIGERPMRGLGLSIGALVVLLWQLREWETIVWLVMMGGLIAGMVMLATGRHFRDWAGTIAGILYLALMAGSFIALRGYERGELAEGKWLGLGLWIALWVGDTAAYGVGSKWGRRPLAPSISPKKSVEGFIAGFAGSALVLLVFALFGVIDPLNAAALTFSTGIVGQLGDLVESQLKRDAGVKDASSLLPGHGGVLDRFDSFLFASPFMFVFLLVRSLIGY